LQTKICMLICINHRMREIFGFGSNIYDRFCRGVDVDGVRRVLEETFESDHLYEFRHPKSKSSFMFALETYRNGTVSIVLCVRHISIQDVICSILFFPR
jgi:hypothetical protein